jgi:hypothetical protein
VAGGAFRFVLLSAAPAQAAVLFSAQAGEMEKGSVYARFVSRMHKTGSALSQTDRISPSAFFPPHCTGFLYVI